MGTKPECPYCGRTTGLRQVHEGCGSIPAEYTCEGCFTATDTGPCFDDLPLAPVTMTPREAGEEIDLSAIFDARWRSSDD